MRSILKLATLGAVSTATISSYYYIYGSNSQIPIIPKRWRRVEDEVDQLLEDKMTLKGKTGRQLNEQLNLNTRHLQVDQELLMRSNLNETMKDIWNKQIRTIVRWIFSVGN
ncbi:Mic12p NDAI_0B04660 [Naumovozyma dairenensis CBS 421]|uniref:MICOS complex subunit MIC12 n=1 Tax=Naumovozyma dairenensis (strain ATCC 10597 / BCRC 20456 / CBS 421 / NBRC 0211 / NRRL Y-12639) TaxID=1071378 RepID=G0W6U0_NAUDC|nr:hypothetical protein NDAI_0B04660 [Naumovozyma dairenensis CBS 421]CCD23501.1 hypothetical protein NDAI_0B04660 [Naumovozyma dairenensis CBS 421]